MDISVKLFIVSFGILHIHRYIENGYRDICQDRRLSITQLEDIDQY